MLRMRSWNQGLEINFDIARWRLSENECQGLIVKFRGRYRSEHSRKHAGAFMRMVVAATLEWANVRDHGLIVDLSELDYRGGDEILDWRSLAEFHRATNAHFRTAIVWSARNRDKIISLLRDEGSEKTLDQYFDNVNAAVDCLCGASKSKAARP